MIYTHKVYTEEMDINAVLAAGGEFIGMMACEEIYDKTHDLSERISLTLDNKKVDCPDCLKLIS